MKNQTIAVLILLSILTVACGEGFEAGQSKEHLDGLQLIEESVPQASFKAAAQREEVWETTASSLSEAQQIKNQYQQDCKDLGSNSYSSSLQSVNGQYSIKFTCYIFVGDNNGNRQPVQTPPRAQLPVAEPVAPEMPTVACRNDIQKSKLLVGEEFTGTDLRGKIMNLISKAKAVCAARANDAAYKITGKIGFNGQLFLDGTCEVNVKICE